jgi:hypothetical protein
VSRGACLFILLLAGCGATAPVDEKDAGVEAGYGRAFGRLSFTHDGREPPASTLWNTTTLTLFVRHQGSRRIQYMEIAPDGAFLWPLERGDYVIIGFQLASRGAATSTRTGRVMGSFSVARAGQAVYVGDLLVQAAQAGTRMQVFDRYAMALERVGARLAEAKQTPEKGLLRLEAPPGRYRRVRDICGGAWAIECDANYRGVQPLAPEGTAWNYAATADRAPLLEWKPGTRSGITYDVAVYEALDFMFGASGGVRSLRGELVAYAEALQEPRYRPAPLEPGKRYEWSVRLRDGDTVSTWSSTSYSFFALVAAKSASGQYFGFETPR